MCVKLRPSRTKTTSLQRFDSVLLTLTIFKLMRFLYISTRRHSENFSFVHYNSQPLLRGAHFQSCLVLLLLIDHSAANLGAADFGS